MKIRWQNYFGLTSFLNRKNVSHYYLYHNTTKHVNLCTVLMYTCKKVTPYFHTLRAGLARGASKHKLGGNGQEQIVFVWEYREKPPKAYYSTFIFIPSMTLQPLLGPGLPSDDAFVLLCLLLVSSILIFLGYVICPSGRCPPSLFLVFPLVLYYVISH